MTDEMIGHRIDLVLPAGPTGPTRQGDRRGVGVRHRQGGGTGKAGNVGIPNPTEDAPPFLSTMAGRVTVVTVALVAVATLAAGLVVRDTFLAPRPIPVGELASGAGGGLTRVGDDGIRSLGDPAVPGSATTPRPDPGREPSATDGSETGDSEADGSAADGGGREPAKPSSPRDAGPDPTSTRTGEPTERPTTTNPGTSPPGGPTTGPVESPVTTPTTVLGPLQVPTVSVPPVSVPTVSLPPVSLPTVGVPGLPTISVPTIEVPPLVVPPIELPPISIPPIELTPFVV
jgi:hypothetical protein